MSYSIYFFKQCIESNCWIDLLISISGSFIGGLLGGLLLYLCYINCKEEKKDLYIKKSICTTSLLSTQTVLLFQMQELKALESVCQSNLNTKISDFPIKNLLDERNHLEIVEQLNANFNSDFNLSLKNFTDHLTTKQAHLHVINLPHEVFSMLDFKMSIEEAELFSYLNNLSECNRQYIEILARIERFNEVRDLAIVKLSTEDQKGCGYIIVENLRMCNELTNKIASLLNKMNDVFDKTDLYLEKIGLFKPFLPRDINRKLIFLLKET